MARIRTIKNDYFTDDKVGELSKDARLLFIGLWTIADREGRLEDRPRRIKVQLMPYDDDDVNDLLHELDEAEFIVRYEAEGEEYIQIINFVKHQRPHPKEPKSTIPALPETVSREKKRRAVKRNGEDGQKSTFMDNGHMDNGDGGQTRAGARVSVSSCDDEYLSTLQANEAYTSLSVKAVYGKMVAWCSANHKMPTRRRLVNWLNREDKPMSAKTNGSDGKMVV